MAQGVLAFKYEEEGVERGMTALAGLPVYLDFAHIMGLSKSIRKHLHVRDGGQGWSDEAVVLSLILLNLAGGDCVEDLRILEADEGFCRLLQRVRLAGLSRKERREIEQRWRKQPQRSVPSPSSVFRYLSTFHDPQQEARREAGRAFIPAPSLPLQGLMAVNRDFLARLQAKKPKRTATLDLDATLVATNKAAALYCYEHYKAYQPLNVWWAEQGVVVHTEFRDGNVPAGYEQLRVLKEALSALPEGVEKVSLRIDTAGYEWDLLEYCAEAESERFGVIEFAVGVDVTVEFKRAVAAVKEEAWQPLRRRINGEWIDTEQQWAEVCFVPNRVGRRKEGPAYRFIAIRESLQQIALPGMQEQQRLPFPTMEFGSKGVYKLFGIVTNRDLSGEEVIGWHRGRCGKSEEAHGVMKEDLAGGKLPSGDFGENAAWWWIMILALNLNEAMKRLVLEGSWVSKRMKAIRFALICIPAWVRERARQLRVRLSQGHPSLQILVGMRQKIMLLAETPLG